MKKQFITLSFAAIVATGIIFSCKKKDEPAPDNTNTTTTGSTTSSTRNTTSGSTTGTTTTGGSTTGSTTGTTTTGGASTNLLSITQGTVVENLNIVTFGTNTITPSATGYQGYPLPNYWSLTVTLPTSTVAVNAVYTASNSPLPASTNCFVYLTHGGTVYSQLGGTVNAMSVNGKQRIKFDNLTFTSSSSTVTASADYVQP